MDTTQEVIYLLSEVFYGYADFDSWPESAKHFYKRMAKLFAGMLIESKMSPEQVKEVLEKLR